ncbi:MAG TPA: dihydroorotate dehydrogenase electron transfer subunit [Armatimonadota bacterium]
MNEDWPRDEAPVESAGWIEAGENPAPEAEVLPAPSPRFLGCVTLLQNAEVKPGHFRARIDAPQIAASAKPGQFLNVRCSPAHDPLLRRPLSISRVSRSEGWVEFIYRVVGQGTDLLRHIAPGAELDVMGPLGTPFVLSGGRHILVGGGVGIPPMLFLAEALLAQRAGEPVAMLMGGRARDLLLCEDDFASIGIEPVCITDDGSTGRQGLVTELLDEALSDCPAAVYACGPVPMLRAVARVAEAHAAPCQVAFEARMACGLGACLSCVIPTVSGYQRVCTEGPAINAAHVIWTAELNLH